MKSTEVVLIEVASELVVEYSAAERHKYTLVQGKLYYHYRLYYNFPSKTKANPPTVKSCDANALFLCFD